MNDPEKSPLQFRQGYLLKHPNINIYDSCIETIPCYHDVKINGSMTELDSVQIKSYLDSHNIPVPEHFNNDCDYDDIGFSLFSD